MRKVLLITLLIQASIAKYFLLDTLDDDFLHGSTGDKQMISWNASNCILANGSTFTYQVTASNGKAFFVPKVGPSVVPSHVSMSNHLVLMLSTSDCPILDLGNWSVIDTNVFSSFDFLDTRQCLFLLPNLTSGKGCYLPIAKKGNSIKRDLTDRCPFVATITQFPRGDCQDSAYDWLRFGGLIVLFIIAAFIYSVLCPAVFSIHGGCMDRLRDWARGRRYRAMDPAPESMIVLDSSDDEHVTPSVPETKVKASGKRSSGISAKAVIAAYALANVKVAASFTTGFPPAFPSSSAFMYTTGAWSANLQGSTSVPAPVPSVIAPPTLPPSSGGMGMSKKSHLSARSGTVAAPCAFPNWPAGFAVSGNWGWYGVGGYMACEAYQEYQGSLLHHQGYVDCNPTVCYCYVPVRLDTNTVVAYLAYNGTDPSKCLTMTARVTLWCLGIVCPVDFTAFYAAISGLPITFTITVGYTFLRVSFPTPVSRFLLDSGCGSSYNLTDIDLLDVRYPDYYTCQGQSNCVTDMATVLSCYHSFHRSRLSKRDMAYHALTFLASDNGCGNLEYVVKTACAPSNVLAWQPGAFSLKIAMAGCSGSLLYMPSVSSGGGWDNGCVLSVGGGSIHSSLVCSASICYNGATEVESVPVFSIPAVADSDSEAHHTVVSWVAAVATLAFTTVAFGSLSVLLYTRLRRGNLRVPPVALMFLLCVTMTEGMLITPPSPGLGNWSQALSGTSYQCGSIPLRVNNGTVCSSLGNGVVNCTAVIQGEIPVANSAMETACADIVLNAGSTSQSLFLKLTTIALFGNPVDEGYTRTCWNGYEDRQVHDACSRNHYGGDTRCCESGSHASRIQGISGQDGPYSACWSVQGNVDHTWAFPYSYDNGTDTDYTFICYCNTHLHGYGSCKAFTTCRNTAAVFRCTESATLQGVRYTAGLSALVRAEIGNSSFVALVNSDPIDNIFIFPGTNLTIRMYIVGEAGTPEMTLATPDGNVTLYGRGDGDIGVSRPGTIHGWNIGSHPPCQQIVENDGGVAKEDACPRIPSTEIFGVRMGGEFVSTYSQNILTTGPVTGTILPFSVERGSASIAIQMSGSIIAAIEDVAWVTWGKLNSIVGCWGEAGAVLDVSLSCYQGGDFTISPDAAEYVGGVHGSCNPGPNQTFNLRLLVYPSRVNNQTGYYLNIHSRAAPVALGLHYLPLCHASTANSSTNAPVAPARTNGKYHGSNSMGVLVMIGIALASIVGGLFLLCCLWTLVQSLIARGVGALASQGAGFIEKPDRGSSGKKVDPLELVSLLA